MKSLPPISTPLAQRWREFRIQILPVLVFAAALSSSVYLWRGSIGAPVLTGEVEAIRADLSTPAEGILTNLLVRRLQSVKAGEAIAVINTATPDSFLTRLSLIEAKDHLARLQGGFPDLTRQRNLLDFEQLRYDLMRERVNLATSQIDLQRAENELRRVTSLRNDKYVSEQEFDFAQKNHQALQTEVKQRGDLVNQLAGTIERLEKSIQFGGPVTIEDLSVSTQELAQAEATLNQRIVRSPIDGVITEVYRAQGELVRPGEPILTVTSLTSTQIVGYLRSPVGFEPKEGMSVKIRTRNGRRQVSLARILHVGGIVERVRTPLGMPTVGVSQELGLGFDIRRELGLPLVINLPPDLKVRPGELVDVILMPKG